jgi:eukaryotic-like serine/threonine-protein kinase
MAYSEGTILGPYKILSLLGAGGMGEVYRAYDPRICRQVAIKVLPPNLFSDPDRLRRFDQEARAAGRLSHPNILVIHDVGLDSDSPYLVTEFLEGETLRERLKRGRIAKTKAIEYAMQIARGIAAAHEKGIVHRDLKPENIFICNDGRVKILDFGLAKLTHRNETEQHNASKVDTATRSGIILGTVGYMSPEQIQGLPADTRSDIFSFGAILVEMLSGKQAFKGGSSIEILNSILKDEPLELSQRSEDFPSMLQRLARSCLEKNPGDRFQSISDLAVVLDAFAGSSDTNGESQIGQAFETSELFYRRVTFQQGHIWSARFSPDGGTIVYGASWNGEPCKLFLTRPEASESLPLLLPDADILSISSKGEMAVSLGRHFQVGYESSGTLAHLPITGGAPREVLEDVEDADWTADGTDFVIVRRIKGQYCLEFPMGNVIHKAAGWCNDARLSPDGKFIAFVDHPKHGDDAGSILIVDTSGNQKVLSEGWTTIQGIAWSADGVEVWFVGAKKSADRAVHAISRYGNIRTILRVPVALEMHDISPGGRVLISRADQSRRIGGLFGNVPRERDLTVLNWSFPRALSPDGQKLLLVEQGGRPVVNKICIRKTDGSPAVQIGEGFAMDMSPDWKWALILMDNGQLALLPSGAGKQKYFPNHGLIYHWAKWLPDQERIVFSASESGGAQRLYIQDLNNGKPIPITKEGAGHFDIFMTGRVSPDGKSVVGWNTDRALTLFSLEDGKQQLVPDTPIGQNGICWSDDSNSLYTVGTTGLPARIFRVNLKTGQRELWKEIWPAYNAGIHGLSPFLMTSDLQSIVYSYRRVLSDLYLVEGLR